MMKFEYSIITGFSYYFEPVKVKKSYKRGQKATFTHKIFEK